MIRRIEELSSIEILGSTANEILGSTAKQKLPFGEYASTIRFGRKEKNVFFETIKSLCNQVWEFLKYNVFFCFFDAEEEKDASLLKELEEFSEKYFEISELVGSKDLSEEILEIKEDYGDLKKEIKELLRSSFDDEIKSIKPKITKKKLLRKWKQVQENPLIKVKLEDGTTSQPLMMALISAQHKLKGYDKGALK